MVLRGKKKAALHDKLELLRSVTNSSAAAQANKTSIIVDASKYIQELKQRVETLNQEVTATSESSSSQPSSSPVVEVESVEQGFLINVISEANRPGLLVSVLEALEEVGLDVLDARVSCTDTFHLEAVGGDQNQGQADRMDAQAVKQAVLHAITNSKTTRDGIFDEEED